MRINLPVANGNIQNALQDFLRRLLETGLVDLVLAPMRTPAGTVAPALVSDPALLSHADPLAPVMPVNSATLVGKLSCKTPRPRLAALLRACELRALIELVKMQQASLNDLVLIAVDCAGTYSVPDFVKAEQSAGEPGQEVWRGLFQAVLDNPSGSPPGLRAACQICEQPVFDGAQVRIELFGSLLNREVAVSLPQDLAEKLELIGYEARSEEGDTLFGRAAILKQLVASRSAARDAEFAGIRSRLEGETGIQTILAACIRCHNCMTVCPICYCKTCVFKSPLFDHEPMQFDRWARQKGAYRLPADTTLFHLTRLNHMVLSCVGCGMCTEACPAELPVGLVFRAIGQRLQATFDYAPGRSLDDSLPLVTFKADEWVEVGE